MTTVMDTDNYWRGFLSAGGFTSIPRWTRRPVAGAATLTTSAPQPVSAAARRLAESLNVSVGSLLLAAHAQVMSALSGEREISTGLVLTSDRAPLPCRIETDAATWSELVHKARDGESAVREHTKVDLDQVKVELGLSGPVFETVLDISGMSTGTATETDSVASLTGAWSVCPDNASATSLPQDVVLQITVHDDGPQIAVRSVYRTDAIDADFARRITGYHLAALSLMTADPHAAPADQCLLSEDELRFQLEDLVGPRRELPDHRLHELFEQNARTQPDAVAAAHGGRSWTYCELNSRANQLGRALLAHGLQREEVVAVVTERNLDWLASVLAIFKAGGTYLPIEPHFPAERIARTLARAECTMALTEPGSTTSLDQAATALPTLRRLLVDEAYRQAHPDDDLGIVVSPDQLAYIYFTSGSTGEPKGAMCEHAGMLNHLFAKIDDCGVRPGNVVAQIAPQCFDISLWQLVSALVVGGRTLIIEQDVILDIERFVDTIITEHVNVMQVVPSYLEVLLTYVEHNPRDLPDLHCVSATGEALKKEHTERWFATKPGVALVNAYGLTETSDDTNHEVMHQAPSSARVPLGPSVGNVNVYIVDDNLMPVPLGAPGQIVFSGVCVGRGYINDPERTRQAYLTDPHRKGQRLYRGGDYGRWTPEGKLDFLGRKDTQVKIAGFRIEVGEIENALLRAPGVRDGAVVVAQRPDHSRHLVAFYAAPQQLEVDNLTAHLHASLPEYMVPATYHWQESLPLTANGKIDKLALTTLAQQLQTIEPALDSPTTPTERRLASAWSQVLGLPHDQISRQDSFFERGGTSLSAVKLAIALDRQVSLKDLIRNPVLADLARRLEEVAQPVGSSPSEPGRSGSSPSGHLLHAMGEPAGGADGATTFSCALVCFPYAGGNAVNYQPLAKELAPSGVCVYAVELPGHDLTAEPEPFAPMSAVVEQVVAEIIALDLDRILLWGHSSGCAFALETARRLHSRGIDVERVYLGAQLLGDEPTRRGFVARLDARSNTEIANDVSAHNGYTELRDLDAARSEHIGAAYRHDCLEAHRAFVETLSQHPQPKLSAPVTVVVAADDPSTAGYPDRHQDWSLVTDQVDLYELPEGGHYFLRTRPAEAARAVLHTAPVLTS